MKIKHLFLTLLLLPSLTCCGGNSNEINKITFGTLYHQESIVLETSNLVGKLEKENFLLAVHPDKGSCSCWSNFEIVLNAAAKRFNLLSYKVHYSQITDELVNKGFLKLTDKPSFYIVNNGKIAKRFIYPSSTYSDEDIGLFFNEETLLKTVKKYCAMPTMYLVNEEKLDSLVTQNAIVYFMRESCPDCEYCTPNIMKNYLSNKVFNNSIYVFDLDPYYNDGTNYQAIKDKYSLSSVNPLFGYGKGVVPTFQVYRDGKLKDACVYFNETIAKKADGTYYISESYYSSIRIKNLSYTDTILDGLTIPQEYIVENSEYNYLGIKNSQYHASLYDPILTSFLDMYLN